MKKKQRLRRRGSENCGDARALEKWWIAQRFEIPVALERPSSSCSPLLHPLSGYPLSQRIRERRGEKNTSERCFDRLFSPVSVSLPLSLPCPSIRRALSLVHRLAFSLTLFSSIPVSLYPLHRTVGPVGPVRRTNLFSCTPFDFAGKRFMRNRGLCGEFSSATGIIHTGGRSMRY